MEMDCVQCANDLDHCHGTLVLHMDGLTECSDHRCDDLHPVRHTLTLVCEAALEYCFCTGAEPEQLRRAS